MNFAVTLVVVVLDTLVLVAFVVTLVVVFTRDCDVRFGSWLDCAQQLRLSDRSREASFDVCRSTCRLCVYLSVCRSRNLCL